MKPTDTGASALLDDIRKRQAFREKNPAKLIGCFADLGIVKSEREASPRLKAARSKAQSAGRFVAEHAFDNSAFVVRIEQRLKDGAGRFEVAFVKNWSRAPATGQDVAFLRKHIAERVGKAV